MSQTIKLDAMELFNPTVVRVSLVNRGANRSPIRKLKSEDVMKNTLDLSNLQSLLTQKAEVPVVEQDIVAAITSLKGEASAAFQASLEEDGLVVAKSFETEAGTTLVFDAEADLTDVTKFSTVQVSGDVAIVVKGFSPWGSASNPATPFEEAMKAQGFYSSFYGATELLMERMDVICGETRTKAQFAESIEPLVSGFSAYITSLAASLPDTAFKMATKAAELVPEEDVEPVDLTVVEEVPVVVEPETVGDTDGEAQTAEETVQPVAEPEQEIVADEPVAEEPVTEPAVAEPAVTEAVKADSAEVEGVAKILAALNSFKEEQTLKFEDLEKRMTSTAELVNKTARRTTGGVATSPPQVVAEKETTPVQKDAGLSRPIDTAYRSVRP